MLPLFFQDILVIPEAMDCLSENGGEAESFFSKKKQLKIQNQDPQKTPRGRWRRNDLSYVIKAIEIAKEKNSGWKGFPLIRFGQALLDHKLP